MEGCTISFVSGTYAPDFTDQREKTIFFFGGTVCLTVLSPVGYGLYEFLSVSNSSEIFLLLYVLEVMIIKAAVGDH
jgi:hypothetical protein